MRKLPIVSLLLAASLFLLAPMAHANDGGKYWPDEISDAVQEDATETVAPAESSKDDNSGCVLGATTANGVSALVFLLALLTGGALSLRSRRRERE